MRIALVLVIAQCLVPMPETRPANVFVTLEYDYAVCCQGRDCTCRECHVFQCKLTQEVERGAFEAARLKQYAGCTVTQLTPDDGFKVQCGVCTETPRVCRYNGADYADRDAACVTPLNRAACEWF